MLAHSQTYVQYAYESHLLFPILSTTEKKSKTTLGGT